MIDRPPVLSDPQEYGRDERSMRLVEYALALMAFGAALLLAIR